MSEQGEYPVENDGVVGHRAILANEDEEDVEGHVQPRRDVDLGGHVQPRRDLDVER